MPLPPAPTFDRFTDRAREALSLAQDEARRLGHEFIGTEHVLLGVKEATALGHGYVGTEHLLLGILREGEGVAAGVLGDHGVTAEHIRADVLRIVGRGPRT